MIASPAAATSFFIDGIFNQESNPLGATLNFKVPWADNDHIAGIYNISLSNSLSVQYADREIDHLADGSYVFTENGRSESYQSNGDDVALLAAENSFFTPSYQAPSQATLSATLINSGDYGDVYDLLFDFGNQVTLDLRGGLGKLDLEYMGFQIGGPASISNIPFYGQGIGYVNGGEIDDPLSAPEPATWVMFIGGFGLIGAMMRRKKATVSFA